MENLLRSGAHLILGNRSFYYKELAKIAQVTHHKVVLEIGSGKAVGGDYSYSASRIFDESNEFIQSDVDPSFGHRVIDVTTFGDIESYDVVLCLNVLEHVYDHAAALRNLHNSLRHGGLLVVAVPFAFPLHDEPADYWRFTEHGLRIMLSDFADVQVRQRLFRRLPTGYFAIARRG